jgi:glycosyltransferase involved in cell wall biosynthesis
VRALVDGRPALDPGRTGVGIYTDRLLRHLPAADPAGRYGAWYLHARGAVRPRRFFADVAGLREFPSRFPARFFGPLSTRIGWPGVRVAAEVFLATNFVAPPLRPVTRRALVVHDLAFERHPETAPHLRDRWRRTFAAQLATAAAVIVPSRSARDDLVAGHDVDPERIHVVRHGVDPFEAPAAGAVAEARRRFGIGGSYALFVGGLEPRKNLEALVAAFGALEGGDAWLVIAGGPVRWFPEGERRVDEAIAGLRTAVRSRVVRTGYVTGEDKRALVAGATCIAYPSLAEGFGLPVLEGFAAGVPVLTSNVSALPEVAGDAAVLVAPDPIAIADGLGRLMSDAELRAHCIEAGRERVAAFTWSACAMATASVLHGAAEGDG